MKMSETTLKTMPPHQILRLVHRDVGDAGFRDSRRFSNLVKDCLCFHERVRDQMLMAIIKGIHIRIIDSIFNENDDAKMNLCISTLMDSVGMSFEHAENIVYMMAYSLERISSLEGDSPSEAYFSFIDDLLYIEGKLYTGFASITLPDGERHYSGQWEKGKPKSGLLTEKTGQVFEYSEINGQGVVEPM